MEAAQYWVVATALGAVSQVGSIGAPARRWRADEVHAGPVATRRGRRRLGPIASQLRTPPRPGRRGTPASAGWRSWPGRSRRWPRWPRRPGSRRGPRRWPCARATRHHIHSLRPLRTRDSQHDPRPPDTRVATHERQPLRSDQRAEHQGRAPPAAPQRPPPPQPCLLGRARRRTPRRRAHLRPRGLRPR